jgi:hypothetical protein
MLRRVAVLRTDVLEEYSASIIWVTRIGKLVKLEVISNLTNSPILVALIMKAIRSSETSVLKTVTRCNIPEGEILHSHRHENKKSYIDGKMSYKKNSVALSPRANYTD